MCIVMRYAQYGSLLKPLHFTVSHFLLCVVCDVCSGAVVVSSATLVLTTSFRFGRSC